MSRAVRLSSNCGKMDQCCSNEFFRKNVQTRTTFVATSVNVTFSRDISPPGSFDVSEIMIMPGRPIRNCAFETSRFNETVQDVSAAFEFLRYFAHRATILFNSRRSRRASTFRRCGINESSYAQSTNATTVANTYKSNKSNVRVTRDRAH